MLTLSIRTCNLVFLLATLFFNNVFAFDEPIDKYSAISNFSLVNKPNLTKILKAKIFVHKDRQLRAAHLILSQNPLSSSFQVPKYVIKVKDRRLHLINIAVSGFLNPSPAPKGVQLVEIPSQYTAEEEATPFQLTIKDEEQVVEVSDFEDDFEVFNQPQSPKVPAGDFSHLPPAQVSHLQEALIVLHAIVLQHKTRSSLLDLLESYAGGNVLETAIQTKSPTPPSAQVPHPDPAYNKRKRD